jgi:hypothetical protein
MRYPHCIAGFLASLVVAMLFAPSHSIADGKCVNAEVYNVGFVRPENRLGAFRIKLDPPDYKNDISAQQHLVFSRIWGRMLADELRVATRGSCEAFINAALFPDLLAFMIINEPLGREADRIKCTGAMQNVLSKSQPTLEIIKQTTLEEAWAERSWSEDPGHFTIEASDILKRSLQSIYAAKTIMQRLASVGAFDFESVDIASFQSWLQRQRAMATIEEHGIPRCSIGDLSEPLSKPEPESPLDSSVVPPQSMNLKISVGKEKRPRLLRHVVILGLNAPRSTVAGMTAQIPAPVIEEYCNRQRTLTDENGRSVTATVRCLRVVQLLKPWVVLFCDPTECSNDADARGVAIAIANDPDILALASENKENGQPKGPYLVNVEIATVQ